MISHVTRPFRLSLALPFLISAAFLPVSPPMKAQTAPIAVNPILPGPSLLMHLRNGKGFSVFTAAGKMR